jgi:surface antigen
MKWIVMSAVIVTSCFLVPAYAVNETFLKDAPISRLSEAELKAFLEFVGKTLDSVPDGATVEWRAPKTTFTSKMTVRKSFSEAGPQCREATVESDSGDRQMRGLYRFCKTSKGWQFKASPAKSR